ncbi:MAG: hypothetical protein DMF47_09980, partial [Verrucomicrobia bacterium]
ENAQLRTAEADLELARANLQRTRDLAARKVVSKSELDAAESAFGQKKGTVDNMRSMIGKKEVHAPFDGQLGIRQVNVGQMINAGQQVVALTSLDPVYVDFALPQQRLSELSTGLEVNMRTDAFPGRVFHGTLTAINSAVDVATRNVTLQATLGGSRVAGKAQDARHSRVGGLVRALRRLGLCDPKEKGSEERQRIANNSISSCPGGRSPGRFRVDHRGSETR